MTVMTLRLMCVVLLARAALAAPSNMNKDDRSDRPNRERVKKDRDKTTNIEK
ncbi:unnamed protein product [Plutella xylostella]|uniref:(diamondback moth) hypothetical protein n=1 Tax=Plutella xylostella TaxID=51655 RepID=A0A8S4FYE0_PLUXY|nr:unnamed protein product [Plutella xylostella]